MAKVKCELCKKELHSIQRRHLAKHGYTKEQYIKEFPNVKLCSEERSERGKIAGRIAVKSGQLSRITTKESCSKGGKKGGKISGRKNAESGQIKTIRTKESCSKGGKTQGRRNVESGRLKIAAIKGGKIAGSIAVKSGQLAEATKKSNTPEAIEKQRQTNIANGYWVPDDERSDWERYYLEVWRITERKQNLSMVPNIELRGLEYSLDHKYSIKEGFKNNIPAEIIGHWTNLEIITKSENSSKNSKCSITLEQLKMSYESATQETVILQENISAVGI